MAEESTGKFGLVIRVKRGEAGEKPTEVECFVTEQDARWSVIATPVFPSEVRVNDSSWDKGTACAGASCEASPAPDKPLWDIAGYEKSFVLRKVKSSTVRTLPQTKDVALRLEPRPQAAMLLAAYSTALRTTSPDNRGRSANIERRDIEFVAQKMLEAEHQRLLKEMKAMRNALEKPMRTKSPDKRRQEHYIGSVIDDGVEEEDEGESGSNSDGGDVARPDNAPPRRLNSFAYHTAEGTPGGVGGGGIGGRGVSSKTTKRRRHQSFDGEDRDEQPAERNVTGRRMSPRRPRRGGDSRQRSDSALVLMEMQKEMLMLIKEMRATPVERGLDKDDAPWKAAWPLPHLVDPLKRYAHGGLEVETEVVMGWLLTQDDLEAKVRKSTEHQVSGDEQDEGDEDADKPDKPGKGSEKGSREKKDERA